MRAHLDALPIKLLDFRASTMASVMPGRSGRPTGSIKNGHHAP